jgi:hypothetical protein
MLGNDAHAAGKAEVIDLSLGAAIPSNNSAIIENPAALPTFQDKIFDIGMLFNNITSPDFAGSFSFGTSNFGFGAEVERVGGNFQATGAIGASISHFSLGVGVTTTFAPFTPTFSVGLRQEIKSVILALVFPDILNLSRTFILGIGTSAGTNFKFATDFIFSNNTSGFGISGARVAPAAEFFASQKYSFKIGYEFTVIPNLVLGNGFSLGLSYWLSKKIAIYGLYHPVGYDYALGMKFAI